MSNYYGPWPIGPFPLVVAWYDHIDRLAKTLHVYCYGYRPSGELVTYQISSMMSDAELAFSNIPPRVWEQEYRHEVIHLMQSDVTTV